MRSHWRCELIVQFTSTWKSSRRHEIPCPLKRVKSLRLARLKRNGLTLSARPGIYQCSLCATFVFSVSLWFSLSEKISTTEIQRTQSSHREEGCSRFYGALVCHCAANGNRHRQPKRWGRKDHYRH